MAYLGFHKGEAKFSLVITQRVTQTMFSNFFPMAKKFFCQRGGHGPMAPPKCTTMYVYCDIIMLPANKVLLDPSTFLCWQIIAFDILKLQSKSTIINLWTMVHYPDHQPILSAPRPLSWVYGKRGKVEEERDKIRLRQGDEMGIQF